MRPAWRARWVARARAMRMSCRLPVAGTGFAAGAGALGDGATAFAVGALGAAVFTGAVVFAAVFAGAAGVSRTMEAVEGEGVVAAPLVGLVASSSVAPGLGARTSVAVLDW